MYVAGVWEQNHPLPSSRGRGCLGSAYTASRSPEPPSSAPACLSVLPHQPEHQPGAEAKQSLKAVPTRCSFSQLPPALCLAVGLASPSSSTQDIPWAPLLHSSAPRQLPCPSNQGIALERAWARAPKAPACPASRSLGNCPHISGGFRPNNMVLSCEPALLKLRAALGLYIYGFIAPYRSSPRVPHCYMILHVYTEHHRVAELLPSELRHQLKVLPVPIPLCTGGSLLGPR